MKKQIFVKLLFNNHVIQKKQDNSFAFQPVLSSSMLSFHPVLSGRFSKDEIVTPWWL